jgi:peptidoglycan-associated lipoprotein
MGPFDRKRRFPRLAVLVGALLVLSACAHVNRDELAAELDQIRQEIRAGNDQVAENLGRQVQETETRLETRIAAVEDGLSSLRSEFDVTVERLENAVRFNAPVYFGFDDDTVRPQDREVLDRFAQVVSAYYDDALITVEGFTDTSGPAEYNLQLGMRRAEAVRDYLAQAGIPEDRMRTVSYGQSTERQVRPGDVGPGTPGWQNRRVAMVIDFVGSATPPSETPTVDDSEDRQ